MVLEKRLILLSIQYVFTQAAISFLLISYPQIPQNLIKFYSFTAYSFKFFYKTNVTLLTCFFQEYLLFLFLRGESASFNFDITFLHFALTIKCPYNWVITSTLIRRINTHLSWRYLAAQNNNLILLHFYPRSVGFPFIYCFSQSPVYLEIV